MTRQERTEYMRKWRAKHPGRQRDQERARRRTAYAQFREKHWRANGVECTYDQFLALCERAGNRCQICRRVRKLYLDHDHVSGKIRGVLCARCNSSLGAFKDSAEGLREAIAYLEAANAD